MGNFVLFARALTDAGISHRACHLDEKRPAGLWEDYQTKLPTHQECEQWYGDVQRMGIITGKFSRRLTIDFDYQCESYPKFAARCAERGIDLASLPIYVEKTLSDGKHLIFNTTLPIGNEDLCKVSREISPDEVQTEVRTDKKGKTTHHLIAYYKGKKQSVEMVDGKPWITYKTIETRGDGGFCVVAPSPGYEMVSGDLINLPPVPDQVMLELLEICRSCSVARSDGDNRNLFAGNPALQQAVPPATTSPASDSDRKPVLPPCSGDVGILLAGLPLLKTQRADDYKSWISVLAVCSRYCDLDNRVVPAAIEFSMRSAKFKDDSAVKAKLASFKKEKVVGADDVRGGILTIGSLIEWVRADSGDRSWPNSMKGLGGIGSVSVARGETGGTATPPAEPPPVLPDYPIDVFSGIDRDIIVAAAQNAQMPFDLPANQVLSMAAYCATRAGCVVYWSESNFEPLNIYTATVADASEHKSTVLQILKGPLLDLEEAALADSQKKREEWLERKKTLEARLEQQVKKNLADAQHTRQELQDLGKEPHEAQYFIEDITPEALGVLVLKCRYLFCSNAEGTLISSMMGRYAKKGTPTNIEIYNQLYSGEDFRVNRNSRETIRGRRCFLTIGTIVQPSCLVRLGTAVENSEDIGLLSRIYYSVPRSFVGFRSSEIRPVPKALLSAWAARVGQMMQWQGRELTLSPEAKALLLQWHRRIEIGIQRNGPYRSYRRWCGKIQIGGTCRLAGILHLLSGCTGNIIQEDTFRNALRLSEYFLAHAAEAYAVMGRPTDQKLQDDILDFVSSRNVTRVADIQRLAARASGLRAIKAEVLKAVLTQMCDMGLLSGNERDGYSVIASNSQNSSQHNRDINKVFSMDYTSSSLPIANSHTNATPSTFSSNGDSNTNIVAIGESTPKTSSNPLGNNEVTHSPVGGEGLAIEGWGDDSSMSPDLPDDGDCIDVFSMSDEEFFDWIVETPKKKAKGVRGASKGASPEPDPLAW